MRQLRKRNPISILVGAYASDGRTFAIRACVATGTTGVAACAAETSATAAVTTGRNSKRATVRGYPARASG